MTTPERPQRVRVTRSSRPAAPQLPSIAQDLHAATPIGALWMEDLRRAQLRLAVRVLGSGALSLAAFPLLFLLVPSTRHLSVAGMPFPWLVLGVLVYPAGVLMGWQYTRAAERLEQEFVDLVKRR